METRIRVLGGLMIAVGIFGALMALAYLDYAADGAEVLGEYLPGAFVTGIMIFILGLTLPYAAAGLGLIWLKSWARAVAMVVLTCGLANFPLGTALGVYGLSMLSSDEVDEVFSPRFER